MGSRTSLQGGRPFVRHVCTVMHLALMRILIESLNPNRQSLYKPHRPKATQQQHSELSTVLQKGIPYCNILIIFQLGMLKTIIHNPSQHTLERENACPEAKHNTSWPSLWRQAGPGLVLVSVGSPTK